MKVAIFEGAGKPFALGYVEDPTPAVGEVVIKVGRCGICGTDLHMTSGHGMDFPAGTVLGHEYAGEVVAVGADVAHLKIGDRIAAMPAMGCGRCAACLANYPLACPEMQGKLGGFGEYLRASAASSVKLPDALSLADGALVEPLAVGLHGVALAAMPPGARVLVLGAGSVGLAAIFWARRLGAGRIVAAARSERRATLAGRLGADGFVTLGDGDVAAIHAALGGAPDLVMECAGAVGLLGKAIDCVRPAGLVVSLGFCASPDPIVPATATWKQVRMAFSFGYTLSEFQFTTDTLDAGHLEPRDMITETVSLEALPEAFEALRRGGQQTKVHVDPWAA
jgi:(R,R)-butanediol dehydrogenase/meso-butanediol dehydrogenase/diacetyl reductase